jgi:hypothetical protein
MGKIVRAGAGIFDKLEPELEPDKNGPAPQHWITVKSKSLLIILIELTENRPTNSRRDHGGNTQEIVL